MPALYNSMKPSITISDAAKSPSSNGAGSSDLIDNGTEFFNDLEVPSINPDKYVVLPVAQQQGINQCISDGANADLQLAPVS